MKIGVGFEDFLEEGEFFSRFFEFFFGGFGFFVRLERLEYKVLGVIRGFFRV